MTGTAADWLSGSALPFDNRGGPAFAGAFAVVAAAAEEATGYSRNGDVVRTLRAADGEPRGPLALLGDGGLCFADGLVIIADLGGLSGRRGGECNGGGCDVCADRFGDRPNPGLPGSGIVRPFAPAPAAGAAPNNGDPKCDGGDARP